MSHRNTRESLGGLEEKAAFANTRLSARVLTALLALPKFHSARVSITRREHETCFNVISRSEDFQ